MADQRMYQVKASGKNRWMGCDRIECNSANVPCRNPDTQAL
jgi:hypothetical protein